MSFEDWRKFWQRHKKGYVFRVGVFGMFMTGAGFIGSLVATAFGNGLFALLVLFFAAYFLSFVWLLYGNVNHDERYYQPAIYCGDIFIVASIWYGAVWMSADLGLLWAGTLRSGSQDQLLLIGRVVGEFVVFALLLKWYSTNRLVYCIHMFKDHLEKNLDSMDGSTKSTVSPVSPTSTIAHV